MLPPLSLYIHYPWCERKCPYCDFNSHEATKPPEGAYIDALLQDLRSELHHVHGRVIETVFIGGGTPSLMSPSALQRLMTGIGALVDLSPQLEDQNPRRRRIGEWR